MKKLLLKLAYAILRHYRVNPLNANVGAELLLNDERFRVTRCNFVHYSMSSKAYLEAVKIKEYKK